MLIYLLIGILVQILVTTERVVIRKVASFKDFKLVNWGLFTLLATTNVLAWPVTIIAEIINIKNGI